MKRTVANRSCARFPVSIYAAFLPAADILLHCRRFVFKQWCQRKLPNRYSNVRERPRVINGVLCSDSVQRTSSAQQGRGHGGHSGAVTLRIYFVTPQKFFLSCAPPPNLKIWLRACGPGRGTMSFRVVGVLMCFVALHQTILLASFHRAIVCFPRVLKWPNRRWVTGPLPSLWFNPVAIFWAVACVESHLYSYTRATPCFPASHPCAPFSLENWANYVVPCALQHWFCNKLNRHFISVNFDRVFLRFEAENFVAL